MKKVLERRTFLGVSSAGLVSAALSRAGTAAVQGETEPKTVRYKKALKFGMVKEDLSVEDKFKLLKDLGFNGVELDGPSDLDRREVLKARDAVDFPIPSVIDSVHWQKPLSDPDPAVREAGRKGLEEALHDARTYGASSVLLVPAVVRKDVPYDVAYRRSQAEIRKVLPVAQALGVKIAIENVWNWFLMSPLEMARYVDELDSPWVGVHFDVGNVVNFGWPEHWIRVLGPRIVKLDIKEFSREKRDAEGLWAGFKVKLGEGSIDWTSVRHALEQIGYEGWVSAEVEGGDRTWLTELSHRMDSVLGLAREAETGRN
ncbi:MAG: sugar phosphate isomerase/epimerase [Acidobacteriota bacterium]|jgi:L-ribulose-5-phosphate 3-epimerase